MSRLCAQRGRQDSADDRIHNVENVVVRGRELVYRSGVRVVIAADSRLWALEPIGARP